ncbi:UDP-4-keto-6-deoxy-N-acetylglucosamine 4-aminotransferase [Candidatus Magnetobacterium bavaricum]|uniref:UDP-4-keto-6-deoxy-N-acetylglucosamine 4-aminotransferase n=1 Tax=Candidatus Magnetobacterium bavaricum TaxID=29290 RepID=A0A0F3GHT7_9BACT|nr:UDP-4-keto-6-deoxy-N-acetylglucosamine 4-aminotransferase [Candidatus Magnetobacterium bavaricum]
MERTMPVDRITYGRQSIDEDDIAEVVRVLRSDFITRGRCSDDFEERLAARVGASYAVVFNSGTSALHGAYFAAGVGQGDEFITSPTTFVATTNAGVYLGARPLFADIEPDTGNIDVAKIQPLITKKTRLIVPVAFAGHPVDNEGVFELALRHNLIVVEDACHALGAGYRPTTSSTDTGKYTSVGGCLYAHMSVLSFHPVKAITTGEGGAVLTNDSALYDRLRSFSRHGINRDAPKDGEPWLYEMHHLGYNYIMTDFQAALGLSQLGKLEGFIKKRRHIAKTYNEAFRDNPYFHTPPERNYAHSAWHLYFIRLKDGYKERKGQVIDELRHAGVGVAVHYVPVYQHPFYREMGYVSGLCPVAEDFYQREISLPIYPSLSDAQVRDVIERVYAAMSAVAV